MATQSPGFSVRFADAVTALLAEREIAPRARLITESIAAELPEPAVAVYVIQDQDLPQWQNSAFTGDVEVQVSSVEFTAGTLGELATRKEPLLFAAEDLVREDYSHLNIRRTAKSFAYLPLMVEDTLIGAIEIVTFDAPLSEVALENVAQISEIATSAIASAIVYENERNRQLESITRVTQMYDLEKVFNSTLEMEELLPVICSKFQEVMAVQAVNLWMVKDENSLLLLHQSGVDPTASVGDEQKKGEGVAFAVSESGEPDAIDDPNDERLQRRNGDVEEGAVFSLIAFPITEQESLVAVAEAINKLDGTPFDDDDVFLLTNIAETASGALHNASLLQAERKVEILQTLVQVSQEITSTLNLDRVLQSVVNGPQAVIPYERAAIAIEERGKLQLKAISGKPQFFAGDAEVARLRDVLYWVEEVEGEIQVTQREDEVDAPNEKAREIFREYFRETGYRSFYALPLIDDHGKLGIVSYESSDPDFLGTAHIEMIKVLGGQATVAIRNAELYKEVPFIGILEPVLHRKRKFFAMEKQRRRALVGAAAAVIAFLALFPLPMRIAGDASVAPLRTAQIQPEVSGVVKKIYVHEGDRVQAGSPLADLEDWEYQANAAAAQAKLAIATAAMNKALASGDDSEAGIQKNQVDFWRAEAQRAALLLEHTHLRSPIDGVVATPQIEYMAGRRLQAGDNFAQVVDSSRALVNVAVPEEDVTLLRAGRPASVKLESLPTRTFKGDVTVISPTSVPEGDSRVFYARVAVPNNDGAIRPGMAGRGKVSAGWHPAAVVLFRGLAIWFWSKLWSWIGW